MRRVTIKEAARCLDVDEDVVQTRIKNGQLVVCQDPEFRGYVWLKDVPEPPPEGKTKSKTQSGERKPRTSQRSPEAGAVREPSLPPEGKTKSKTQSGGKKPRTSQRSPDAGAVRSPQADPLPPEPEAQSNSQSGERKPRTSQQPQEVELLQEAVAMLKEELGSRDRQLELKDGEIQARREEVKELLEVLQQQRALPAAQGAGQERSDSIISSLRAAYILAVERVVNAFREVAAHFSRLVFRNKHGKSAGERN